MNLRTVTISFDPAFLDSTTSAERVASRTARRTDTGTGTPRYNYPTTLEDVELLIMHAILAEPAEKTIRALEMFGIELKFTETKSFAG